MIPESVPGRAGLGLVAAGLLLGASYWWLDASAASAAPAPAAALVVPEMPASPEVLAALAGAGSWLIYLAAEPAALPEIAAPVVAIEVGGRLRLLRPPPAATGPRPEGWLAVGLVLPSAGLATLGPHERAALLEVLGAIAGPRDLRCDQLVPVGLRTRPGEVAALLRWLR